MSPRGCAGGPVGVGRRGRISTSPVVPSCVHRERCEGLQRRTSAHPSCRLDLPGQTPLCRVSGGSGGSPPASGGPPRLRGLLAPPSGSRRVQDARGPACGGGRVVHGDATGALFLASARRGAPPRPGGRAGRQTDTWPPPDAAFAVPRTDEYKAELCAAPLARVRLGGGRGTQLKKIQTRPTPSQPFAWGVSRGGEVAGGGRCGRPPFSFSPPSVDGQSHRPVRRSRAVAPPATRTCEWGVDRWSPIAYCAASLQ